MLSSIHIENIAIIKSLDLEFSDGFTALTGETGAGKSILIDSISMLTGMRIGRDIIRSGCDSCSVTAVFSDIPEKVVQLLSAAGFPSCDGDDCVMISRSLSADGKSVSKLNGRTVPLSVLKQISPSLICIHGQHEAYSLLESAGHLSYIDMLTDKRLIEVYRDDYAVLCETSRILEDLRNTERNDAERAEILSFRVRELTDAHLREGEREELELKRDRLENLERIVSALRTASKAIRGTEKGRGASDLAAIASDRLKQISDVMPGVADVAARIENCAYELSAAGEDILAIMSDTDDGDPTSSLDKINARLDLLSGLEHKYKKDIPELIVLLEESKREKDDMENADERISEAEKAYIEALDRARLSAEALSLARRKSADVLSAKVTDSLRFMDMENVEFSVRFSLPEGKTGLAADGMDVIEFYVKTNPGEEPRPLSAIASGGELSRIMLSLGSVMRSPDEAGTLIFDEIDTGISGKTAQKIGVCLAKLSASGQVICITHSAQVASISDEHFLITKEPCEGRAETHVRKLREDEKIDELARILGGVSITDAVRANACELIAEGKKLRQ